MKVELEAQLTNLISFSLPGLIIIHDVKIISNFPLLCVPHHPLSSYSTQSEVVCGCLAAQDGPPGAGLSDAPPTLLGFSICLACLFMFSVWALSNLAFRLVRAVRSSFLVR